MGTDQKGGDNGLRKLSFVNLNKDFIFSEDRKLNLYPERRDGREKLSTGDQAWIRCYDGPGAGAPAAGVEEGTLS
jgi:hypothetical protein